MNDVLHMRKSQFQYPLSITFSPYILPLAIINHLEITIIPICAINIHMNISISCGLHNKENELEQKVEQLCNTADGHPIQVKFTDVYIQYELTNEQYVFVSYIHERN